MNGKNVHSAYFDFFKTLMDTSPDYIYFKDRNSSFIMVNRAAAKALGCKDPADAIGKSDFDFFPDIAEQTREDEVRIMETGEPQIDKSLCVRFADGLDHWVSITKTPIKDNQGTIVGIMGISRDITKRVSLEKSLNECTTIHKHVFDASPNCMYIKDKDGRYIIANKTIADLYQTTPDKMIGKTDADFANQAVLRPAEATFFIDTDLKAIQTKEKQVVPLEPFTWNDGTTHYFHTTKVPIRYEDDDSCVLGISVDITDVKIADDAIKKNEERLRRAEKIGRMGNWDWDVVRNSLIWSQGLYKIFEIGPEFELTNENIESMIHPEDKGKNKEFVENLLTSKDTEHIEFRILTPSGNLKYLHQEAHVKHDSNGFPVKIFGIMQDITDKKIAELSKLKDRKLLDSFLASSTEGYAILDKDLNFVKCNERGAKIIGFHMDELVGKNIADISPDVKETGRYESYLQVMKTGEPIEYFDLITHPKLGSIHLDLKAFRVDDGLGIVINDVTSLKNAEKTSRENALKFESLFETIKSGVAIYQPVDDGADFIFKDFNRAAETIENITREKVIGKRVTEVFPGVNDFGIFKVFQRVYKTGKTEFLPEAPYRDDRTPERWRENWVYKLPTGEIVAVYDDVTERRKAENEIQHKNRFLDTIINEAPFSMWISDENGTLLKANKACLALFGASKEEIVGKYNLFKDNVLIEKDLIPQIEDVFKKGKTFHVTLDYDFSAVDHVDTKHATHKILEAIISPVFNADGKVVNAIVQDIDRTEIVRAQEEFKESEQKLRSLVNVSSEWIWQVDKNAVFEYVSDSVKDVIGYDPSEIIGKTPFDFMDDDEQKKIEEIFEKIVEQKGKIVKLQESLRHKNNENIFFETDGIPLLDENGDLTGYFGICRDVTNRKRYEELLTNERNKLTSIFDGIDEAIYVADIDTHELLYMNGAIKKNWGDRVGEKCYKALQNRDSTCPFCTNYKLIKNPDKPYIWEFQNEVNKEWYRCIDRLIPWVNNKMVRLELAINITDLKHIQKEIADKNEELDTRNKELHKAQDQLKELNKNLEAIVQERTQDLEKVLKLKDDFINQLGHDLKNPLGPMVNLLPILETRSNNKDDKEIFAVINRNVDYIRNLVKKTLELAQLNSPSFTLNREETMLHNEVEYIISMQKSFVDHHRINVTNLVPKNVKVSVDKLSFKELLINLLNNAVKYSPDGGTITIDATKQDDTSVIVSMTDSGIGMTEGQIPHLFDEFYKVDGSRHDFNSSGLGLSICKKIVEKHGGRIWAESKGLGKGSTFYFMMPTDDSLNP